MLWSPDVWPPIARTFHPFSVMLSSKYQNAYKPDAKPFFFLMNSALPQAIDWEARWQQGKIPWDHGEPSQALVDLLQEGVDLIPDQGTVLVPGCGSGYDVYLLAESSPERKVIGLDLFKTCIDQCNKVNGGIQS